MDNKNKNDSSSVSTNQQFNLRDVNSFTSTDKTYNRFNNNISNQNIQNYNTNSNLSMVNYQANSRFNGMVNSTTNFEGSTLYQKKIEGI